MPAQSIPLFTPGTRWVSVSRKARRILRRAKLLVIAVQVCASRRARVCATFAPLPSTGERSSPLYISWEHEAQGTLRVFHDVSTEHRRPLSPPWKNELHYPAVPRQKIARTRSYNGEGRVHRLIDRDRLHRCGNLRCGRTRSGKAQPFKPASPSL